MKMLIHVGLFLQHCDSELEPLQTSYFCVFLLSPLPAPSVGQCSAGRGWDSPLVRMFTQKRVCGAQAQALRHLRPSERFQIKAQLPSPPTSLNPSYASRTLTTPACSNSSQQRNAMHKMNNTLFTSPATPVGFLCIHACNMNADVCMYCSEYIRHWQYVWADTEAWWTDIRKNMMEMH